MTSPTPSPAAAPGWTPNPRAHTLSLPEQIAERIGNDIIHGRYEPGARIQEQDVADSFQVSRGPVREALRILERDGLIQINARRGAQVSELSVAELNEIFEPRIALNGLAARCAAQRREPESIARFRAAVERIASMAAADDHDGYLDASYGANRALCDAAGNPFLSRLVFLLAHQTLRYSRLGLSTTRRRQQSARNWRRTLAAVTAGDSDEAQAAAEQLARDSRDTAVRLLNERQRESDRDAAREAVAETPAPAPVAPRQPRRAAAKRS